MQIKIGERVSSEIHPGQYLTLELEDANVNASAAIVSRGTVTYSTGALPHAPGGEVGEVSGSAHGVMFSNAGKLHLYSQGGATVSVSVEDSGVDYSPFPGHILTGRLNGHRRLRVDQGQTGFFEGREFRTFREMTIGAGQRVVMRATCGRDFILGQAAIAITSGEIQWRIYAGASEVGGFPDAWPLIRKNAMSSAPIVQSSMQLASSAPSSVSPISGGLHVDTYLASSSGQGNKGETMITDQDGVRGLPAGALFHYEFYNPGQSAVAAVFHGSWEERE